jgi:hypothetical protein
MTKLGSLKKSFHLKGQKKKKKLGSFYMVVNGGGKSLYWDLRSLAKKKKFLLNLHWMIIFHPSFLYLYL